MGYPKPRVSPGAIMGWFPSGTEVLPFHPGLLWVGFLRERRTCMFFWGGYGLVPFRTDAGRALRLAGVAGGFAVSRGGRFSIAVASHQHSIRVCFRGAFVAWEGVAKGVFSGRAFVA